MTFIIALVALIAERFFHWSHLRNWRWYPRYKQFIHNYLGNKSPKIILAAMVLPPVILVGAIDYLLSGWFYDSLKMIFGIVVVLYCLGLQNLWVQVFASISEINKDPKLAVEHVNAAFEIGTPANSQAFHRAFANAIFYAAFDRVFAVVFWFVILGPLGAVLYRMVAMCAQDPATEDDAVKAEELLDWVPIRVFTFLFALGGHFTDVFTKWKGLARKGLDSNREMLSACGIAALDLEEDGKLPEGGVTEKEAMELLDRVFVMGLVILAMVVLVL